MQGRQVSIDIILKALKDLSKDELIDLGISINSPDRALSFALSFNEIPEKFSRIWPTINDIAHSAINASNLSNFIKQYEGNEIEAIAQKIKKIITLFQSLGKEGKKISDSFKNLDQLLRQHSPTLQRIRLKEYQELEEKDALAKIEALKETISNYQDDHLKEKTGYENYTCFNFGIDDAADIVAKDKKECPKNLALEQILAFKQYDAMNNLLTTLDHDIKNDKGQPRSAAQKIKDFKSAYYKNRELIKSHPSKAAIIFTNTVEKILGHSLAKRAKVWLFGKSEGSDIIKTIKKTMYEKPPQPC